MAHLGVIMYICIQPHAYVKGDISGNPGSKKNPKEHICSQTCAPVHIYKQLWKRSFPGS